MMTAKIILNVFWFDSFSIEWLGPMAISGFTIFLKQSGCENHFVFVAPLKISSLCSHFHSFSFWYIHSRAKCANRRIQSHSHFSVEPSQKYDKTINFWYLWLSMLDFWMVFKRQKTISMWWGWIFVHRLLLRCTFGLLRNAKALFGSFNICCFYSAIVEHREYIYAVLHRSMCLVG